LKNDSGSSLVHLNYHHLHYFWFVAKEGNLTRAAEKLRVSQSALSVQIRQLERQLGQPLFQRVSRRLVLTEAGRIALGYAEKIFPIGSELVATLQHGKSPERQVLRVGAVATLSRNFQRSFFAPLFPRRDVELVLHAGSLAELLPRLGAHLLDLVLSNREVHGDAENPWRCRRIARQPISLVGRPRRSRAPFLIPDDLRNVQLLLPGASSEIRAGFDLVCEQHDLRPNILAEVDDMAMLRLLARDTDAVALLPSVVVRDELSEGRLQEYCVVPGLFENFYAISVKRHFEQPLLKSLLARSEGEVLAMPVGAGEERARRRR
jgi:LysR family transcriptional activator of nhaA